MNVYVITGLGGEYDEKYETVIGVYASEVKCKQEVERLNESLEYSETSDNDIYEYCYIEAPFNTESMASVSPIGLMPKSMVQKERLEEVHQSIMKCKQSKKDTPVEWLNKYAELCGKE